MLTRADALAKAEAVIGNPDHPAWLGALKFVVEQAYGKPKPESETGPRILRVVYENALPNLHDEESSRLGPPETQAT